MLNLMKKLRPAMVSAAVAVPMILAGCGGGGSSSSAAPTNTGTPQSAISPSPLADCSNVSGQLDTAQNALLTQVASQLVSVPQVGETARRLVVSIVQLLDIVDIVAAGTTDLQNTRDPMALNRSIADITGLLSCFSSTLSYSLVDFQTLVPGGAAATPEMAQLMAQLNTLNTLLGGGLAGGLGSGVPAGFDLTTVTAQLEAITVQAQIVFGQVAAALPANTPVSPLFPILIVAMGDAAYVVDRISVLDGDGLADATTYLVSDVAARLTGTLAAQLNLPPTAVTPIATTMATVLVTLNTVLHTVLGPLFAQLENTLGTVLGSILGGL